MRSLIENGGLAQLARALPWHGRGHRFDSDILHKKSHSMVRFFSFILRTIYTYVVFVFRINNQSLNLMEEVIRQLADSDILHKKSHSVVRLFSFILRTIYT